MKVFGTRVYVHIPKQTRLKWDAKAKAGIFVGYSEECAKTEKWRIAMKEEMESLRQNKTWTLVNPPTGTKILENKWVYKVKSGIDDSKLRYKARLITKGYLQQEGLDYTETFSPVAKHSTIRTLLAMASAERMEIRQFDIKTAFLYGKLEEEVYMRQPKGFEDGNEYVNSIKDYTDFARHLGAGIKHLQNVYLNSMLKRRLVTIVYL